MKLSDMQRLHSNFTENDFQHGKHTVLPSRSYRGGRDRRLFGGFLHSCFMKKRQDRLLKRSEKGQDTPPIDSSTVYSRRCDTAHWEG